MLHSLRSGSVFADYGETGIVSVSGSGSRRLVFENRVGFTKQVSSSMSGTSMIYCGLSEDVGYWTFVMNYVDENYTNHVLDSTINQTEFVSTPAINQDASRAFWISTDFQGTSIHQFDRSLGYQQQVTRIPQNLQFLCCDLSASVLAGASRSTLYFFDRSLRLLDSLPCPFTDLPFIFGESENHTFYAFVCWDGRLRLANFNYDHYSVGSAVANSTDAKTSLSLYPNPADQILRVVHTCKQDLPYCLKLRRAIDDAVVYTETFPDASDQDEQVIDISSLASGAYTVVWQTATETMTKAIVIVH